MVSTKGTFVIIIVLFFSFLFFFSNSFSSLFKTEENYGKDISIRCSILRGFLPILNPGE